MTDLVRSRDRERPAQDQDRPPTPRRPRRRRSGVRGPWWLPYALIAPAVVLELLIHIGPMALGVWISFVRLTQLTIRNWTSAPFDGFHNYAVGLDPSGPIGSALLSSVVRTTFFTLLVVGGAWVVGMLAAVLLTSSFRGRAVLRTLFLVPYALPVYVVTIGWAFMFNQRDGAVNALLVDDLHLLSDKPFWLLGGRAFWVVVVVAMWRLWPFAFLMLLAALQNIPDDLYEAAALDGAGPWRAFRSVTLPMVRPANAVVLLVMGLWTFNEFNVPYLLFGNSPPDSARLLSMHIYVNSFVDWNFGLGAAMSVLLLLLLLVASVFYLRLVLRGGEQRA